MHYGMPCCDWTWVRQVLTLCWWFSRGCQVVIGEYGRVGKYTDGGESSVAAFGD